MNRWITILENLYYCWRISPYVPNNIKAMKKEKKLYLWDWSLCENEETRFENFVGSHLLKYCHSNEDILGDNMNLMFLRDKEKREIDFIVSRDANIEFAVEAKSGDKDISKQIKYFATRTSIPKFYQVHLKDAHYENKEFRTTVLPFNKFCETVLHRPDLYA